MTNLSVRVVSFAVALSLGACGGGGGGNGVQPAPAPPPPAPPPPTPPPPPPPPPTDPVYDTLEYQNSLTALRANAISAYQQEATGKGVVAAIIDSGFAPNVSQFAGRIHEASTDVAATRGLYGDDSHGAFVASVLGAAKDDAGMHGVAFDSTLLLIRAEIPGSCLTACMFEQSALAKAYDLAIANDARVINMSLQYYPMPPSLAESISRATEAGVVVVLPAGNTFPNGQSQPAPSAMIATQPEGRGAVIIAGATNDAGTELAQFSNRAGTAAEHYLAAVGQNIPAYNKDGGLNLVLGTSFAAPTVAGAVALVAEAFPNLTAQQIVTLLLTTATDMGAPGIDPIWGRGKLNLANAFAPQGATSLAGYFYAIAPEGNAVLAPAMGDASGDLTGIVLDSYDRAYRVQFGQTIAPAAPSRPLYAALDGNLGFHAAALGPVGLSVTTSRDRVGLSRPDLRQMGLDDDEVRAARALAATAIGRLSSRTALAAGFSEGGQSIRQRMSPGRAPAFVVARDPLATSGLGAAPGASVGVRHDLGPLALTMTSERGEVRDRLDGRNTRSGYSVTSLFADRQLGRVKLGGAVSRLDERSTMLGGRFAFGGRGSGAQSWFADAEGSVDFGAGWSTSARYRHGWTSLDDKGGLVRSGRLSSNAFAIDLSKTSAFTAGDQVALRIMQPLRVRDGGLMLHLPTSYDYATRQAGFEDSLLNLAPEGREVDYELSYAARLWGGQVLGNAFVSTQPGHVASASSDVGAAIRFTLGL